MAELAQSGIATLSTLDAFAQWLEAEPPQGKVRQVLIAYAAMARPAIERGEDAPAADVQQLHALYRDRFGGAQPIEPITGKWLPVSTVTTWWEGQKNSRRQFLQRVGAETDIELLIDRGGGRGNATTYRLAFPGLPGDAGVGGVRRCSGLRISPWRHR